MKKRIIFILALFVISAVILADEAEDILTLALEKQNYQTLQADVTVETTMEGSNQKMIQEYKYIVKKPDKVKMDISKPFKQTMVMSEGVVSIKMPDGKVIRQKQSELPGVADMNLQQLQTIEGMKAKYQIARIKEYGKDGKTYVEIKLAPKSKGLLPGMIMVIEKSTGKIVENKVIDNSENIISETLYEKIINVNNIYVPVEIKTILKFNQKEYLTKIKYINTKINTEITGSFFKLK